MQRRTALRASDADREGVAVRLRDAAAEGRLLASELEERLERLFSSRTYGELDSLVSDLPVAAEGRRRPGAPVWVKAGLVVAMVVAALAVVVTILLFLAGLAGAWVAWMAVMWLMFGRRRWRCGRRVGWSGRGPVASRTQAPASIHHGGRPFTL